MTKHWYTRRLHVKFSIRKKSSFPGRFGGGWNWKVGIQAGSCSVLISLLIAELVIERRRR